MPTDGRIITFYSYKGGTGRSMVLANTAWILASQGKRVLTVDWDLEAPGLHRYFHPFLVDPDLTSSEGIIDFAVDYQLRTYRCPPAAAPPPAPGGTSTPPDVGSPSASPPATEDAAAAPAPQAAAPAAAGTNGSLRKHANRLLRSVQSLDWAFPDAGTLDFLAAGKQGPGYAARVNSFNWADFYRSNQGWELFEEVRALLREEYDYVLIDSRTGVSDTSGICSVQMPDALVVCFTLNNQGIEGASGIAHSVTEQRRERQRPIDIFPVPMRVENAEKDKVELRKAFAQQQFERFHFNLPEGIGRMAYWTGVLFPYVPYYAYEEILATFGDRQADATSLIAPALRLTACLAGQPEIPFVQPSEEERSVVLELYARNSMVTEQPTERRVRQAEDAYRRMSAAEQSAVYRVFTTLIQPSRRGAVADTWRKLPMSYFDEPEQRVIRELNGSALQVSDANSGEESVQLADERLPKAWVQLREWTVDDREFLLWKRRLATSLAEWDDNDRDDSSLLRGARLFAALKWSAERPQAMTPDELKFIDKSWHRHARRRTWNRAALALGLLVVVLLGYFGLRFQQDQRAAIASQSRLQDSLATLQVMNIVSSGLERSASGDYGGAVAAFDSAIAMRPGFAEAYLHRGGVYFNQGNDQAAVEDFGRVIRLEPRNADAYYWRGRARLLGADTTRALEDFTVAARLAATADQRTRAQEYRDSLLTRNVRVDSTVTVNIRYRNRADSAVVQEVARDLGRAGYRVLTVQYRTETSRNVMRYFFPADSVQAGVVGRTVAGTLRNWEIELPADPALVPNYRNLPPGRIEVWIPDLTSNDRGPNPQAEQDGR
ncbi:MAG TPA: tetratricopeptide repeat protein [Longimicrobiaceae bacterium]|nr:tetratricopeptide repeat protein [Longimicrobiaceae bacterium]